jgi:glyoxylase I family protein
MNRKLIRPCQAIKKAATNLPRALLIICLIASAPLAAAKNERGLGSIRNLDHTILICQDLDKMRSFYANTMGLHIHGALPNWVEFQVGAALLTLRSHGRDYDGPAVNTRSAKVQLAFRVPPADVALAELALREAKVSIVESTTDQAWGHRTLFFKDPENNVLEIYAEI